MRSGAPARERTVPLVAAVHERAAAYFPGLDGPVEARLTRAIHRPYSDIYWIALRNGKGGGGEVVVKVAPEAATQFRAMQAVWPHFAAHRVWRIPEPLDLLPEGPALVMEAVPGQSLQARSPLVAWWGRGLARAERDCRRAGGWLRFYHDVGASPEGEPVDVGCQWRAIEESRGALGVTGVAAAFSPSLLARFRAVADGLEGQVRPVAHVHGDFSLDNVLVADDRVTALDVFGVHRRARDHDVASFLNSIELLRLTRPVPRRAIGRLRSAFVTAYFGEGERNDGAVVLRQMGGLLDAALEILGRRRSQVARRWIARVIRESLGALAATAEGGPHVVRG